MAPPIPNEIYRCIMDHFHRDDNRTLVSVAQCSSLLRYESQRVLFHTVFQDSWNTLEASARQQLAMLKRHQGFLEAIVNSPARLGPLVRSYTQWHVAYDARDNAKNIIPLQCQIFELTGNALRCMVNLKELRFSLFPGRATSMGKVLQGCTFQLQCLVWRPWAGDEQAQNFLDSQKSLLHFDAFHWFPRSSQPTCLSPKLKSIRGCERDLFMLNRDRTIVALDFWERIYSNYPLHMSDASDALSTIRFLRIPWYTDYLRLINGRPPWPALRMIELTVPKFEEVLSYAMLPSALLILVIRVKHGHSRIQDRTDAEKFIWISSSLFSRFPVLKYIDISGQYIDISGQSMRDCISSWRYARPANDSDATSIEISDMDDSKTVGWWSGHSAELADNR